MLSAKNTLSIKFSLLLSCVGLVIPAVLGTGCGADPVQHSAPVGLSYKVKPSEVINGSVTASKSIDSESGNPWKVFIDGTRNALGGDPGDIAMDEMVLSLTTGSIGVDAINQVFDGAIDVQIEMAGTKNMYNFGTATVDANTVGREVAFTRTFDFMDYAGGDYTDFMKGSYKVIISGATNASFETLQNTEADLQLMMRFTSYQ